MKKRENKPRKKKEGRRLSEEILGGEKMAQYDQPAMQRNDRRNEIYQIMTVKKSERAQTNK